LGVKVAILISLLAVALLVGVVLFFWWRHRRMFAEFESLRRTADDLGSIVALEHQTNYRLACELYGKRAVDRAVRVAGEKGRN
jgi:hypothetical protein